MSRAPIPSRPDRRRPSNSPCGGTGITALRALGIEKVTSRELRGIRYVDGTTHVEASFRGRSGLGIRRTTLHSALHQRALGLGVRMLPGKVGEVHQSADTVTAAGITARWLIAADGLHSPVRRGLGLELPGRPHGRYGLRRHFCVEPWTDFVEVHWSRHGEAYVTPVGDDLVGIAILSRSRRGYNEHLACVVAALDHCQRPSAGRRGRHRPVSAVAAVGLHLRDAPVPLALGPAGKRAAVRHVAGQGVSFLCAQVEDAGLMCPDAAAAGDRRRRDGGLSPMSFGREDGRSLVGPVGQRARID